VLSDLDLEYILWISNLYTKIGNVPGHIAEIGVATGRNSVLFGQLIRLYRHDSFRKYYGFDTFEGYLERDLNTNSHLNSSLFSNVKFKDVQQRLVFAGLEKNCTLVKGDVIETLPVFLSDYSDHRMNAGMSKFALLYIDCNAYIPAISSMEYFLPFLSPGAMIAIDEKTQGSETKALIDFAEKNGLKVFYLGSLNCPAVIEIPTT